MPPANQPPPQALPSRATDNGRRRRAALAGTVLLAFAGGCQTYQPKPLSPLEHASAFAERSADTPAVHEYAAVLRVESSGSGQPFDIADGVSLREAEAIALTFNAALRLERARTGVTLATAQNSGLWEDPTLGVDLTRILASVPNPWKVMSGVGITLPISGRLEFEKTRDGAAHAAALVGLADQEWQTRIALRDQWARWSASVRRVQLAEELLSHIEPIVALSRRLEQAGELPRVEARLFAVEAASRRGDLLAAKAAERENRLGLLSIMGLAPTADVSLQTSLAGVPIAITGKWSTRGSSAEPLAATGPAGVLDGSPTLATAMAEYETAERTLAYEIQRQYPDFTVNPGYGLDDGHNELLLGLSLPLPLWNANRKAIAESTAQRTAAQARVEMVIEQLQSDLAIASLRLESARQLRHMLEAEVAPLVDQQYEEVRAITRLGEFNALILLESIVRQYEAKVRLTDAAAEEQLAANRIASIVGPAASSAQSRSTP